MNDHDLDELAERIGAGLHLIMKRCIVMKDEAFLQQVVDRYNNHDTVARVMSDKIGDFTPDEIKKIANTQVGYMAMRLVYDEFSDGKYGGKTTLVFHKPGEAPRAVDVKP